MKRLILAAVIAALGLPSPAFAERTENFAWHGTIARGHSLTIKDINGSVHATQAAGELAEVTAIKRGERGDPATVRIEQVERNGDVAICAVWPSEQADQPACDTAREYHVNNHSRDNDVKVDFTVKVPRGVSLLVRDINGSVLAESLSSNVDAVTVNGKIEISTTGSASATSVNGRLTVSLGALPAGDASFTTVNGSIDLTIPRATNANFSAQTLNGSIQSDLPIELGKTGFGRMSHATGHFGHGGPQLACKTLNGNITVRAQ